MVFVFFGGFLDTIHGTNGIFPDPCMVDFYGFHVGNIPVPWMLWEREGYIFPKTNSKFAPEIDQPTIFQGLS